jgi:hypothetical protein
MDILEKTAATINDIFNNTNDPLNLESLKDPLVYRQPTIKGEYPNLITHEIHQCQSSFYNLLHLASERFYNVRDRNFLSSDIRYFLDTYFQYDYDNFLFVKNFGFYKIVVVVKPMQRVGIAQVTTKYCIVAKILLDENNQLVKHDDKPAIICCEESGKLFKFFKFHANYYTQITLDSFYSSSNYSVVCKKYDHSIIGISYYSHYALDFIPINRFKFRINNKDYSSDVLLNYDDDFKNQTLAELIKHMATMDKEHIDLLEMYLI